LKPQESRCSKKKRERKEYSRSTQRQDGDCSAVTVNHRPHPGLAHPCRHKINATSGPGPGGGFDGRPGPGGRGRGGRGFPSIFHMLHLHLAESKKVARKLLYMLLLSSDAVKKKRVEEKETPAVIPTCRGHETGPRAPAGRHKVMRGRLLAAGAASQSQSDHRPPACTLLGAASRLNSLRDRAMA
jgi:hypothetical protein